MSIRPIVVGGPQTPGSFGGLGGLGHYGPDRAKKFTSQECLQALMDAVNDDNSIITNQVTLISSDQRDQMRDTYWPAIFNASAWTRVGTHRPDKDENGEKLVATDREVREYENDVWGDESKSLIGLVTTEHGEIIDIKITAKW